MLYLSMMDPFRRVFSFFGLVPARQPRPNALEHSSVHKLPIEILYQILFLLPFESAVSFSLCCSPIYTALKPRYRVYPFSRELSSELHQERLLTLLERDLPEHIICGPCNKLHSMKKARRHLHSNSSHVNYSNCWYSDSSSLAHLYIHAEFSTTLFEMAMKQYRNGSDPSILLDLLSLKTITHLRSGFVKQQTAVAKIIDGRLFIREQKRFMIPATQPIPFPWEASFVICPHIKFRYIKDLERYFGNIKAEEWRLWKDRPNREKLGQCKYCWSEYRFDFQQFGARGNAMYVTKWVDIGQGSSEFKYKSHVSHIDVMPWPKITFDAGSIFAAFQDTEDFDVDSDAVINWKDRRLLLKGSPFPWPVHLNVSQNNRHA